MPTARLPFWILSWEVAVLDNAAELERFLVPNSSGQPNWKLGHNHSAQEWQKKMAQRGWTAQQITEAIQSGQQFPAVNKVNPGNAATRYVHPATGRSVTVDDVTREVIHVGGDGFVY